MNNVEWDLQVATHMSTEVEFYPVPPHNTIYWPVFSSDYKFIFPFAELLMSHAITPFATGS